MVGRIYHVGLIVSDLDRSIAFYRDILELEFQGEIFMEGEETDKMFRRVNCKARVAYLNGSKAVEAPPVELIQFVNNEVKKVPSDLFTTSISEVCFYTDDIDSAYKHLVDNKCGSACLNRSISILEQMDLGKVELFILETRMESFLR